MVGQRRPPQVKMKKSEAFNQLFVGRWNTTNHLPYFKEMRCYIKSAQLSHCISVLFISIAYFKMQTRNLSQKTIPCFDLPSQLVELRKDQTKTPRLQRMLVI